MTSYKLRMFFTGQFAIGWSTLQEDLMLKPMKGSINKIYSKLIRIQK